MRTFIESLTEPQRVAILYALVGVCFLLAGLLQWLENS